MAKFISVLLCLYTMYACKPTTEASSETAGVLPAGEKPNVCLSNWKNTQKKIGDLENEIICTNSGNWKVCFDIFTEKFDDKGFNDLLIEGFHQTPAKLGVPCSESSASVQGCVLSAIDPVYSEFSKAVDAKFTALPKRVFVNSVEDFYQHMQFHRKRVVELGLQAYLKFPELFPNLKADLVQKLLAVHDLAKVTPGVNGSNGQPFYKILYEKGYGMRIDQQWVDELNIKDDGFLHAAEKMAGLSQEQINESETLAHLVDLVDRVNNEVSPEEFGRPMFPVGDNFKDEKMKPVVQYLEKNYTSITKKLKYTSLSKIQAGLLARILKQKEIFIKLMESNPVTISLRALASIALASSKTFFYKVIGALTSAPAMKLFTVAGGVQLFLADADKLACSSELGMHDWQKESGACKPVAGLTPELIKFLGAPDEVQKFALQNYQHQCVVLQETHDLQQVDRFAKRECSASGLKLTLASEDSITLVGKSSHPESVRFNFNESQGVRTNIEFVLDEQSGFRERCIEIEGITRRHCYANGLEPKSFFNENEIERLAKASEMYQGLAFFIFKELSECVN